MSTVVKRIKYISEYTHKVDEKNRVSIPSEWRFPTFGNEIVLYLLLWDCGGEQKPCLMALPPDQFDQLLDRVDAVEYEGARGEALQRNLMGNAVEVVSDKAGRVLLPTKLAERAGIKDATEVVLIGLGSRFQIWSVDNLEATRVQDSASKKESHGLLNKVVKERSPVNGANPIAQGVNISTTA